MKKTFEHLLGLSARDALALLKGSGIFDVRVTFTQAPKRPAAAQGLEPPQETSVLHAVAGNFLVSETQESAYDPLLEPVVDDGILSQVRVIGVRDDGRQLIVSRFRVTPNPMPGQESGTDPGESEA